MRRIYKNACISLTERHRGIVETLLTGLNKKAILLELILEGSYVNDDTYQQH